MTRQRQLCLTTTTCDLEWASILNLKVYEPRKLLSVEVILLLICDPLFSPNNFSFA